MLVGYGGARSLKIPPGGGRATGMDREPRSKKTVILSVRLDAGEILEVGGEVGMRLATLLSLDLK
jgi:hypothetical protein